MLALTAVNIALRALGEPALSALGDSPHGQEASDRLDELVDEHLGASPFWFQTATHFATTTAASGNGKPFIGGEDVTGGTSGATFQLICIDSEGRVYLRRTDGTVSGTGETLTGATSEATIITSAAYTALDKNRSWPFTSLPEQFARWLAHECGLDLERQYKRGQVDEAILARRVSMARIHAIDFDTGWQGWTANSQVDINRVRQAFTRGPVTTDPLYQD
ncbi:MAG TPA: hypothetical protein VEB22_01250 [Phycisphaerales bacterium]|nr:hypothetical protein [Phycisphaerales bacterium]